MSSNVDRPKFAFSGFSKSDHECVTLGSASVSPFPYHLSRTIERVGEGFALVGDYASIQLIIGHEPRSQFF